MFIAALFAITKTQKPPKCPSTGELIKKMWYKYIQWNTAAAAAAKSLQSCLTLCDPIDGSPTGSPSLGFSRQEHWSGKMRQGYANVSGILKLR